MINLVTSHDSIWSNNTKLPMNKVTLWRENNNDIRKFRKDKIKNIWTNQRVIGEENILITTMTSNV